MMKYFITVFLLIYSFLCFAQREFAPIGAEWYYQKTLSNNPPAFGYVKHKCIKDSIIEGQSVKVLELLYVVNNDSIVHIGYEYIAQNGDTISYWKSGQFHILYNFSLQKGDSMLLYSEMPNQCEDQTNYGWSTINTTFTVNLNNVDLKAYNSSANKGSIWGWGDLGLPIYEAIGSLQYLFPQNMFCGIYDGSPDIGVLRCYSDDSLGFIEFTPNVACDSIACSPLGIELFNKRYGFLIYPNPSSDYITIELFEQDNDNVYSTEIYDIEGSKHLMSEMTDNKITLQISDLPVGNYTLILKRNKNIIGYDKFCKN